MSGSLTSLLLTLALAGSDAGAPSCPQKGCASCPAGMYDTCEGSSSLNTCPFDESWDAVNTGRGPKYSGTCVAQITSADECTAAANAEGYALTARLTAPTGGWKACGMDRYGRGGGCPPGCFILNGALHFNTIASSGLCGGGAKGKDGQCLCRSCGLCPAMTYAAAPGGRTACAPCLGGTLSAAGSTSCSGGSAMCPPGTSGDVDARTGHPACTACAAGQF